MPVFKYVDKNFFKKWSPEMAYVLGFFAADGYITVNKRGGQFWSIQICDIDLLKKIKKIIKSEHKISKKKVKLGESPQFRLQIGSIDMCNDLRNLGFFERKTKNMSIPNIPNKYFSHFVRGYFDGDGNVWVGIVHKNRNKPSKIIQITFTSCSLLFLSNLKDHLNNFSVLNGRIRKGGGEYYRLAYSINSSLKLYYFMYNGMDTGLYLARKKRIFDKYIKMRS